MRVRASFSMVIVATLFAFGACSIPGAGAGALPTLQEAEAHLNAIVRLVGEGRVDRICEFGSGTCAIELRNIDLTLIPSEVPVVVGSEDVPTRTRPDGGVDVGGVLLRLCGHDGLGKPYYSEMLVFRDVENRLRAINTLYWTGARIARSDVTPGSPPPSGC